MIKKLTKKDVLNTTLPINSTASSDFFDKELTEEEINNFFKFNDNEIDIEEVYDR